MKRLVTLLALGVAVAMLTTVALNAKVSKKTKDMRLIVVDSAGAEVGTLVDFGGGGAPDFVRGTVAALASDGRVVSFEVSPETLDTAAQLWYQSPDCTGPPFLLTNRPNTLTPRTAINPPGKTLYFDTVGSTANSQVFESVRDEFGSCTQETRSSLAVPAISTGLDLNRFVPPFTVVWESRE
jgi:hypothetical protein